MSRMLPGRVLWSALLILATWTPHGSATAQPVNPDAQVMTDFTRRVEEYAALHRKIAATVPRLSDQATPEQIDRHQRDFGTLMAKARADAKRNDLFTPPVEALVRRLMTRLFASVESRQQLRESVMDDNPPPSEVRLAVNARYPDAVPLSTMPPDVLKNLPAVPKEVEYRFVGEHLILLDPDAHMVVDFVTRVLPK